MKTGFIFLLLTLLCSSCHVGRFFIWNFAGINDKNKFPTVPIENDPDQTYHFIEPAYDSTDSRIPKRITYSDNSVSFDQFLEENKTVAFLVIKSDTMLYERYFGKYDPATLHPSFSVAKSFVSALIGIAVSEGHIQSTEEPITNYLTYLPEEKFGNITIEHVLDMRSGIRYNEGYKNPFGDVAKYYYGTNLKKYVRNMETERPPGERFQYKSVNTQLLALILEAATGTSMHTYLQEKIWKPLGMESPATWSVDSKKHQTEKAFCCLNAIARDFAKFGRLYLNNGRWGNTQILPAGWVERSAGKDKKWYSYQWWLDENSQVPDSVNPDDPTGGDAADDETIPEQESYTVFYAEGILGQFIFIDPQKELIIVRLGKKYGKVNWEGFFKKMTRLF